MDRQHSSRMNAISNQQRKLLNTPQRVVLGCVSAIALAIVLLLGWVFAPPQLLYRRQLKTGNLIVSRVEAYRTSHGDVPDSLEALGVDEESVKVFYRKENAQRYIVWFGTTLGESMTYDSDTRKWQ
jgi:hypothetical protein